MKLKLLILFLLTGNIYLYAQTDINHELSIEIEGVGTFHDGSTATLKPNAEYILTAKWKRVCPTRRVTWGRLANGVGDKSKIVGPASENWIQVEIHSTGGTCSGYNTCLIQVKPPTIGNSTRLPKPVPNFSMNGVTENQITIQPNTQVNFTDMSTNSPKKWRYAIMVTLNGKRQRVHYTKTHVQHTKFLFTKVGVYRIYFWARNKSGTSKTIFKTVNVR